MGVRDTPRYNKSPCFDSFPFADPPAPLRIRIADAAMRIERHREKAVAADSGITLMKIYDVVTSLRTGKPLSPSERKVHEFAACGVLMDLHDDLDRLVAEAYGWSWPMERDEILARLVTLHDERVQEEKAGMVRWLRPEYQVPRFADGAEVGVDEMELEMSTETTDRAPWPSGTIEQIQALQSLVMQVPRTVEEAASAFRGARRDIVERHLETLALMGEVQRMPDGHYQWVAVAA